MNKIDKKRIILLVNILIFSISTYSQQFKVGKISYSVISFTEKTARLGWQQEITGGWQFSPCIDTNTEGEITIPQTVNYQGNEYWVTEVAMGAFNGCKKITTVKLPSTVKSIGKKAFENCYKLENVELPSCISSIGEFAFGECKSLKNIEIPFSLTLIEGSVFKNSGLLKIHIPESIQSIGPFAFARCPLSKVEIPNSVTSIGQSAFEYCDSLETIVLGKNITSIETCAFSDCNKLKRVFCKSSNAQNCSRYAFNRVYTAGISLYVPIGSMSQYKNADSWSGWSSFTNIEEKNAPVFADITIGGVTIETEFLLLNTAENLVQIGTETRSAIPLDFSGCFVIPSYITDYYGNDYIVEGVGLKAFESCKNLTELHIPSAIKSLSKAFGGCEKLKSLIVDNRYPSNIRCNSEETFVGINSDAILYVPAGTKERYEVLEPWNKFSQIVESSPISVGDISARYGSKASLPIYLKNTESVLGIQFKLTLPEGVSVIENNGNLVASTTERTEGMTIMGRKDQDEINSYLFVALSLAGNSIIGSEGAIMNIQLEIADDVELGIYDIKIEDVYLATESFDTLNPSESTSELTIKDFILGDINSNGNIDIGDAVSVVSYLVGKPLDCFIEAAADMNQNGQIDIGDAVSILNVLVGKVVSNAAPQLMLGENDREPQ